MFFAVICRDNPDSGALRVATKERHKAYLDGGAPGLRVLQSGPLLSSDGREEASLLVIEAESVADVDSFMSRDPYALAGMTASREIRPWLWRRGNPYLATDSGS